MGKTITTYLIDSDPQGPQYVFISNKICKMLVIPRARLSIVNEREELQTPAFYILLGENETLAPMAYLGETENFRDRVRDHDSKKKFWQKALVFISKDGAMTKVDVQYLEYLAISLANKTKKFLLGENKQTPKEPNMPEHQKDSMNEFFEDIKLLTSFFACPIFELVEIKNKVIFSINQRGSEAKGFYDESGFTVLKGSVIAKDSTKSFGWKEKRDRMMKEMVEAEDGKMLLTTDYTFSSPSTASDFCLGRSSNGWTEWTNKEGQTLDAVYRKQL